MVPRDVGVQVLPQEEDDGFVTCPGEVSKGQHSVTCSPLQPQTCAAHHLSQEIEVVVCVSEDKT